MGRNLSLRSMGIRVLMRKVSSRYGHFPLWLPAVTLSLVRITTFAILFLKQYPEITLLHDMQKCIFIFVIIIKCVDGDVARFSSTFCCLFILGGIHELKDVWMTFTDITRPA